MCVCGVDDVRIARLHAVILFLPFNRPFRLISCRIKVRTFTVVSAWIPCHRRRPSGVRHVGPDTETTVDTVTRLVTTPTGSGSMTKVALLTLFITRGQQNIRPATNRSSGHWWTLPITSITPCRHYRSPRELRSDNFPVFLEQIHFHVPVVRIIALLISSEVQDRPVYPTLTNTIILSLPPNYPLKRKRFGERQFLRKISRLKRH